MFMLFICVGYVYSYVHICMLFIIWYLYMHVSNVRGEASFRSYVLCCEFLRYIFLMVQIPQRGETIFQHKEIVVMGKSIRG